MNIKKFSQEEVNRIVTLRLKREQERLAKDFEEKLKRCMASIHLMLYQEMCETKRYMAYVDSKENEYTHSPENRMKESL